MDWGETKIVIAEVSGGMSNDAIHILIGVAIQLALAAVLRVSVAHWFPWLAVLAIAIVNEYYDLGQEVWPARDVQIGESLKDVLLTMAVPTVLLLAARFTPRLLVRLAEPDAPPQD
jgi:hypothetical protein